jgi:hypothetical protein
MLEIHLGRFEMNWLARSEHFATLADLSGHWIDQVAKRRSHKRVVLDMDSSVSPTHGDQESSVWNGHFGCTLGGKLGEATSSRCQG